MAEPITQTQWVSCANSDCRRYGIAEIVSYPAVGANVFLAGPLVCASCGHAVAVSSEATGG